MAGYMGIGPEAGIIVPEDLAFEYAMERCTHGTIDDKREFREMLVEWFYSTNWIRED